MSDALSAPVLIAATVLMVAGVHKLRSPQGASRAIAVVAFAVPRWAVRALACAELALGGWCLVAPGGLADGALAGTYAVFCAFALTLRSRRAACGCFGETDSPASMAQAALSGALAMIALAAALGPVQGVGWVLDRSPPAAAVLFIGLGGAVYATIALYTLLGRAWASWKAR